MPFTLVFYNWMLADEESLTLEDLHHVDPNLYEQLKKLQNLVLSRDQIVLENQTSTISKTSTRKSGKSRDENAMDSSSYPSLEHDPRLYLDGCPIEDLSLIFTLPAYPHIELKKGGKDCSVTIYNLDQYIQVNDTERERILEKEMIWF